MQVEGNRRKGACFCFSVNLTAVQNCHGLMVNAKSSQSANVVDVGVRSTYAKTKCISRVSGLDSGRPRTLQIDFPERRQRQAEEQFTLHIFWKCLWRGLQQPSGELVAAKEHGQKRSCQKVKPLTDSYDSSKATTRHFC